MSKNNQQPPEDDFDGTPEDDLDDGSLADPDELRRVVREVGAPAAFRALLDVCKNRKAPAPARATAATTMMRVAGFLEKTEAPANDEYLRLDAKALREVQADLQARVDAATAADAAPERPKGAPKRARKPKDGLFD